jgi:hypothetical protein
MHGLLTGYSQYYNRKYKKVGHLFQGRYRAILCQTDRYLAELVRYIHLNPVRARMVGRAEEFEYSGHRAYLGLVRSGMVDIEPVLRHFGGNKRRAVEVYGQFVNAAVGEKSQKEYYLAAEGRMLGSEEFFEEVKHRIGFYTGGGNDRICERDLESIMKAAEKASGLSRKDFCTNSKSRQLVMIKEAIIVIGYENRIRARELGEALGLDASGVSKRRESARGRGDNRSGMTKLLNTMRSALEAAPQ